ncbi:host cell division inhibitor Icd-like protein [Salmonella enterica]|nr:host cell division inhibitor Icd-like protein [Salmonella enterica]EHK5999291.1 host cell division inhibitor Icd-like protein [Salmonella enterica]EIF5124629.1 host cell division inhibitor Icd-like protein [Salmonella enterica]EIF5348686.1 host cell division inhibitor Icd-like protein [Salmonella enterica]EIF5657283.1 host cell division inhibitor Icd-like protein [Salmonella enterica]
MATTPTPLHHHFIWRFWSCQKRRYHFVIASSESEARSQLPDAPCIFSARFRDVSTQAETVRVRA